MKTEKVEVPEASMLLKDNDTFDYIDSFREDFTKSNRNFTSTEIGKAFFSSSPKWIEQLFSFRNKIVRIFGLKTSETITDRQNQLENFSCEPNEQLGLFKVFDKTENEVILGENDKHLNFRVSLFYKPANDFTNKNTLTITTIVKFNNWFGRLYFLPVRPFHKLIVPTMLRGIIRNLESS